MRLRLRIVITRRRHSRRLRTHATSGITHVGGGPKSTPSRPASARRPSRTHGRPSDHQISRSLPREFWRLIRRVLQRRGLFHRGGAVFVFVVPRHVVERTRRLSRLLRPRRGRHLRRDRGRGLLLLVRRSVPLLLERFIPSVPPHYVPEGAAAPVHLRRFQRHAPLLRRCFHRAFQIIRPHAKLCHLVRDERIGPVETAAHQRSNLGVRRPYRTRGSADGGSR